MSGTNICDCNDNSSSGADTFAILRYTLIARDIATWALFLASLQASSISHFRLKELELWPGLRSSEAASLTFSRNASKFADVNVKTATNDLGIARDRAPFDYHRLIIYICNLLQTKCKLINIDQNTCLFRFRNSKTRCFSEL
jgi:hypothetical protein